MDQRTAKDALIPLAARVPREHRDALDDRARHAGCSRSEYVAALIRDHVSGDADGRVLDAVEHQHGEMLLLKGEIARLRSDLATVLELVLLNVADLPESDVQRTVSDLLRKRHEEPEIA